MLVQVVGGAGPVVGGAGQVMVVGGASPGDGSGYITIS